MSRIMRGMSDWELKSRRSSSTLRMSTSVGRSGGGWPVQPERTSQDPISRMQSLTPRIDIPPDRLRTPPEAAAIAPHTWATPSILRRRLPLMRIRGDVPAAAHLRNPARKRATSCPRKHHDFDFMGANLPRMTIDNGATERPQSADSPPDTRRSSFGTSMSNPFVKSLNSHQFRNSCSVHSPTPFLPPSGH